MPHNILTLNMMKENEDVVGEADATAWPSAMNLPGHRLQQQFFDSLSPLPTSFVPALLFVVHLGRVGSGCLDASSRVHPRFMFSICCSSSSRQRACFLSFRGGLGITARYEVHEMP